MTKENPFKKAIASRHQEEVSEQPIIANESEVIDRPTPEVMEPKIEVVGGKTIKAASKEPLLTPAIENATAKKRGRPATGKRSDDLWTGRTYYIQRETDLDMEDQLLRLKRQGIDIDKSELVDFLLAAWVKLQKGENSDFRISGITPTRK
jgi:hypothetical protein